MGMTKEHKTSAMAVILIAEYAYAIWKSKDKAYIEQVVQNLKALQQNHQRDQLNQSAYTNFQKITDELGKQNQDELRSRIYDVGRKKPSDSATLKDVTLERWETVFFNDPENKKRFNELVGDLTFENFLKHVDNQVRVDLLSGGTKEIKKSNNLPKDILNTVWFMYHYRYPRRGQPEPPLTYLTRLVLYIDLDGNIKIFEPDPKSDWTGTGTCRRIGDLIIADLKTGISDKKDLQIRFGYHKVSGSTLLLGQYIDVEDNHNLITGSFVLQNCPEKATENLPKGKPDDDRKVTITRSEPEEEFWVVTRGLIHNSGWAEFFPKPIARFLSAKWKNYTKVDFNIYSLTALQAFLDKQQKKPIKESKYNEVIEFDAMILSPTPSDEQGKERFKELYDEICRAFFLNPDLKSRGGKDREPVALTPENSNETRTVEQPNALDEELYMASEFLQKEAIGLSRIYYAPRIQHYLYEDWGMYTSQVIIENELPAMRKSRCVILILNEEMSTSALVKVGWAMAMEKVVFVVPTAPNVLPKVLAHPFPKMLVVANKPVKVSDIPKWIRQQNPAKILD